MNRIYTKPTIFQRIRRSRWEVVFFFMFLVASGAAAEALCDLAGVSYDPRIEVAA